MKDMRWHNLPIMKVTTFLDVMSSCLVGTYRRFGVTSCLNMKWEDIYQSRRRNNQTTVILTVTTVRTSNVISRYEFMIRTSSNETLERMVYIQYNTKIWLFTLHHVSQPSTVLTSQRHQLLCNILKSCKLPSVSCDSHNKHRLLTVRY